MTPTKVQYQRNKELYKARALAYYRTHITEKLEYNKRLRERHKQCPELWKQDQEKNRERCRRWMQKPENRERERLRNRKSKPSEQAKRRHRERQSKWRSRNLNRIKIYNRTNNSKAKYPLATTCEFCGETDRLLHHHPDYEYPELYVTCCSVCHRWIHMGYKEESVIVPHVFALVPCSSPDSAV